jgi:hypothetical protein
MEAEVHALHAHQKGCQDHQLVGHKVPRILVLRSNNLTAHTARILKHSGSRIRRSNTANTKTRHWTRS